MKTARRASLAAAAMVIAACSHEPIGAGATPDVAAKLAFTGQPANTTAGVAFTRAVAVTIEDSSGHTVTSVTDAVTLTIDTGVPGLSGTTTAKAVNGVATFENLSIQKAGTEYFLTAFSGTLTRATSAPFAVFAAAPARLTFTTQASTTWDTQLITPAIQVAIEDAFGNAATGATNAVTLAIGANPGGGSLTGTTTVNAVNGVATFSNLSIDKPGAGYTLVASASGLTRADTGPFAIITPPISVSVTPTDIGVLLSTARRFVATVSNDSQHAGVTWTLTGTTCSSSACGTLSATSSASGDSVAYTAPAVRPPGSVTLTATSVTDKGKSASTAVFITSLIQVSVSPSSFVGVDLGTSRQFTAVISNDPGDFGVTWSVSGSCSGAGCGTISPAGLYTAPAVLPIPVTLSVTATSVADNGKVGNASVVVTTPGIITVLVSPSSATICTRLVWWCFPARAFTAYVFNDTSAAGVSWSAGVGSFSSTSSASGVSVRYTVQHNTCGSTVVTATSVADPNTLGTARVTFFC